MFRNQLLIFLYLIVLAFAGSPAFAVERYLQGKFSLLATTNAPSKTTTTTTTTTTTAAAATSSTTTVAVPADPCLAWGCPSANTACAEGVTGPPNSGSSSCVVNYIKAVINLNMPSGATAALTSTTTAQLMAALLGLSSSSMGVDFGVTVSSSSMASSGSTHCLSLTADIMCLNCGSASLTAATTDMLSTMPPYAFAAMGLPIESVSTCMSTSATKGVCQSNLNTVVGNPAAPSTSSGSSGPSLGVILGAVGGVVGAAVLVGGGYYLYKKNRDSKDFTRAVRTTSGSGAGSGSAHVVSGPMMNSSPYTNGAAMGMGMGYNGGNSPQMSSITPNPIQQYNPTQNAYMAGGMNVNNAGMMGPNQMRNNLNMGGNQSPQGMGMGGYQPNQQQNWNNQRRYN